MPCPPFFFKQSLEKRLACLTRLPSMANSCCACSGRLGAKVLIVYVWLFMFACTFFFSHVKSLLFLFFFTTSDHIMWTAEAVALRCAPWCACCNLAVVFFFCCVPHKIGLQNTKSTLKSGCCASLTPRICKRRGNSGNFQFQIRGMTKLDCFVHFLFSRLSNASYRFLIVSFDKSLPFLKNTSC